MATVLRVDAFADHVGGGNACAVVFGGEAMTLAQRLAFAGDGGGGETVFVETSERADAKLRFYLPTREIPFGGHPMLAALIALAERGAVRFSNGHGALTVETALGITPVSLTKRPDRPPLVTVTHGPPVFGLRHARAGIATLYGLEPADLIASPRTVSLGAPFCMVALRDLTTLRRAALDRDGLAALRRVADFLAPYLATPDGFTLQGDVAARLMHAPPMPFEEAFTGTAVGCMAAYLWSEGLAPKPRMMIEQGHDMGRPGRAAVEVLGPRDDIAGVRVSSSGVVTAQEALTT